MQKSKPVFGIAWLPVALVAVQGVALAQDAAIVHEGAAPQKPAVVSRRLPTMLAVTSPPVVVQSLYGDVGHLMSGAGKVDPGGAVAENASSGAAINVELQRWGGDLVEAALATRRSPQLGVDVIRYGFKALQPDGSFGAENGFQHVSFFLEAAARTMLVLKQSGGPEYAAFVAEYTPKLESAAKYFVASGQAKEQEEKGKIFTHRYWLLASALGETATLTRDAELAGLAGKYARMGLAAQKSDGTNPEKDGYDVNYGAASGLFAIRYYAICTDPALRAAIEQMLRKGMAREAQSVLPDGTISIEDSTRTGKDAQHNNSGKPKGIDTKGVIPFFADGAEITGEARYRELARMIAVKRGWM